MSTMTELPNIGPKLAAQLAQVGINTPEALRATGAEDAWLRIQAFDPSACLHRLTALEGAVRGVPKAQLPKDRKDALKAFYQAHKLPAKK